jgi:hypothetical protein
MLNFNLTNEEFESLEGKYKKDGLVNYFEFCGVINSAFTIQGIDKDPSVRVRGLTNEDTQQARRKVLDFNEKDRLHVTEIIEEYRSVIKNKRLNMKPMF